MWLGVNNGNKWGGPEKEFIFECSPMLWSIPSHQSDPLSPWQNQLHLLLSPLLFSQLETFYIISSYFWLVDQFLKTVEVDRYKMSIYFTVKNEMPWDKEIWKHFQRLSLPQVRGPDNQSCDHYWSSLPTSLLWSHNLKKWLWEAILKYHHMWKQLKKKWWIWKRGWRRIWKCLEVGKGKGEL